MKADVGFAISQPPPAWRGLLFAYLLIPAAIGCFVPNKAEAAGISPDRFRGIQRQKADWSCGAAVLATLMREHLGYPDVDEDHVIRIWKGLPGNETRSLAEGLSPGDLLAIIAAESKRFAPAIATKLSFPLLALQTKPMIVRIQREGELFAHFVIVKGVVGNQVFIADSLLGHIVETSDEFRQEWIAEDDEGLVISVGRRDGLARSSSALKVPGQPGAYEKLWSLREAIRRRDATIPRGESRLAVEVTGAAVPLVPVERLAGLSRRDVSNTVSFVHGVSDSTTILAQLTGSSSSYRMAGAPFLEGSDWIWVVGAARLISSQLDNGTPQVSATTYFARSFSGGPLLWLPGVQLRSTRDRGSISTTYGLNMNTSVSIGKNMATRIESVSVSASVDRPLSRSVVVGLESEVDWRRNLAKMRTSASLELSVTLAVKQNLGITPSVTITRSFGVYRPAAGVSAQLSF